MKRLASVICVKEDKLEEYKRLHAAAWPGVLQMIADCHIRNYSIYLRKLPDGKHYLFSYLEYMGEDWDADMARMSADPVTRKWQEVCSPCQEPLSNRAEGEWWSAMEEVFHFD